MDLLHGLVFIGMTHLLAVISPGPDFALVSQQTLVNGKKAGFYCVFGICLGLLVHILYSTIGLGAIILGSANFLIFIKVLGGSYLIYMGYKGLRATVKKNADIEKALAPQVSKRRALSAGFLCNVLNPKAMMYFVAVFSISLSPDMSIDHLAIYAALLLIIPLCWFSFVVILLSHPRTNHQFQKMSHWIERLMGIFMLVFGANILFSV